MSNFLFVTVSDDRAGRKGGRYSDSQDRVHEIFKAAPEFGLDRFAFWKWSDITGMPFYKNNRRMLDHPDPDMNGRCYKPFVILAGLRVLADGEFLVYNDISHELWGGIDGIDPKVYDLNILRMLCLSNGGILSACAQYAGTIGDHSHENFTLERCINKMGLAAHRYDLQHASGMMVFHKSRRTMDFVEEWLHWNLDDECASLGPVREEDLASIVPTETVAALNGYVVLRKAYDYWNAEVEAGLGKIGHRHDQSISGLLINKLHGKLVVETENYNLLNFCRRDRRYDFIDSNQAPQPFRLKMRHGTTDGTDGRVDRVPR